MAGKLWRIDGGDRAGRALSTILGLQTLRYWLLGSWGLAIAAVAGLLPAAIWLAVSVLAGIARGRYEANLARRGVTGAQFTAVATASSAIWAVGPAIAYTSGGAPGMMVAVCLILCGSVLVATQFRDMPRRALVVTSPYAVAGLAFSFTSPAPVAWAFLTCGLASGLTLYANMLFGARHRAQIERYEAEQRRLISELETARDRADAANQAKSAFLAMVSHELRTPMNGVLGAAQLLHETPLAPQQKTFVSLIQNSGDSLLSLLNDILDFAKIEAGRLDLRLAEVGVERVVGEVEHQLYPLARDKGLLLETRFEAAAPRVRADEQRLRQVLLNLVSNAIKFTEAGHVTLRTYEATLQGRRAVAIAVRDTGPGISPDFLPYLFERFTQEARVYASAPSGTGVGLTISRELVHRMG
ncbi:MAG TPA: histidine kinase dimerization/phospho-acceptor domain-containing protein, partial [Phenylobacterium sp.]|nr:histidine kinase dimerization/phospho-acceptor domain-containing protein [Phenylobacterium sp.]